MAHKTNAVRLLDQLGIPYEMKEDEFDPEELAAEIVGAKIGMDSEQVPKTLAARGDRYGICLAVIRAIAELDLKSVGGCFWRSQA